MLHFDENVPIYIFLQRYNSFLMHNFFFDRALKK